MSNQIDGNGITVQTFSEILNDFIEGNEAAKGLKQIYGADINVDSNSPDGQWVNTIALAKRDILELLVQIYNSKDPDQAVGIDLDAVSQLCGISRKGGTYTEVNVIVNTDRTINLSGQDTASPYTLSDSIGNEFQLIASAALVAGDNTLAFRATKIGVIQVSANTINTQVTIVLGVQSVNNTTVAYQTGVDQETDAQLRLRRQQSTSLPAQGMNSALTAGLNSLTGMNQVVVYENITNAINADGVPGHSIWVIVDGGAVEEVADIIFKYRNAGCGMYGGTSVFVDMPDGTTFQIMFDRVVTQSLYIRFHLDSINSGTVDNNLVKNGLVADYVLKIYQAADITTVTSLIHEIDATLVVSQCQVSSDNVNWFNSVLPSTKKNKFTLAASQITIV